MGGQRGGAPPNEKAAARGRGSGQSRKPSATRTTYTATAPKARQPQAGEITIYDSLDFIGHLVPKGTGYLAFAADGAFLGLRTSSRVAAGLVYQAARPRGQS